MDDPDLDAPLSADEVAALDRIIDTLARAIEMVQATPELRLHDLLVQAKEKAERMLDSAPISLH